MGYNEDGVWLGDCPSFELDTESCCVSLNMCAAARESWRQTTEPRSHTLRLRCCVTLTLTLSLTSIPILVNAALLFIVTNCTCGWAVFYLLAEPAVFALILMVVRLQPNAAQCCSPMLQPMRCSPSIFRRSCNSMCSEAATLAARGCNSLHARR